MVHLHFSLCQCHTCKMFFISKCIEGGCYKTEGQNAIQESTCNECGDTREESQTRIRLLTDEETKEYSQLGIDSDEHKIYNENFHNAFSDSEEFLIPAFMRRRIPGHAEYQEKITTLQKQFAKNIVSHENSTS